MSKNHEASSNDAQAKNKSAGTVEESTKINGQKASGNKTQMGGARNSTVPVAAKAQMAPSEKAKRATSVVQQSNEPSAKKARREVPPRAPLGRSKQENQLGPGVCPVCKQDASKSAHKCKICAMHIHAFCGDATLDQDGNVEEGYGCPRLCSNSDCQAKGSCFKAPVEYESSIMFGV